jgi:hypothetical protein
MGHGVQRFTQAHHGKLPLVIPEGMTRPVVPTVATKFATECNIAVRNHITHWSEYNNQLALFDLFVTRIHVGTFSLSIPHLVPTKTIIF